jgi:integrase
VKGSVYQRCFCRDPETKKPLGRKCPKLKAKGHAQWFFRYSAPITEGGKRRQPEVGPFRTKAETEEELAATLARIGGGAAVMDRSLKVGQYLDTWLEGKRLKLKARTYDSYVEACELYWRPAVGHLRLVDLRTHHLQDAVVVMAMMINKPIPAKVSPALLELHRRMVAVRADDARRVLAAGETRHKKSTKPLSASRIEREFAVIRAALNAAVPRLLMISPAEGVELPRVDRAQALAWTPAREARFWAELVKRASKAEAAANAERRVLTTVERQALWSAPDLPPSAVMVWRPEQVGAFLDYLVEQGERLAVLFTVAAYCGMRRDELLGLTWAETDLAEGVMWVRKTGSGDAPKSEAGIRAVPLAGPSLPAMCSWRERQEFDRMMWGPDWPDHDLVFTREDGTPVPGQWTSTRFETLAYRAGLPPIRLHDLRHGAASLLKAAGVDTAVISAILGHTRTDFTNRTYVTIFAEVAKDAAEAAAAIVPRKTLAQDS